LRSAEVEPLASFRSHLAERLASESLDRAQAGELAARIIRREIIDSSGESGERSLEPIEKCAAQVDEALTERADKTDELAARASLLRVTAGSVKAMHYAAHVTDADPAWRAVGARSLTLPAPTAEKDSSANAENLRRAGAWRRKLVADPDQAVRLGAVQAALEARDPADADALLETARLDPDPEVRATAMMAAGALATADVVRVLRDLWEKLPDEERVRVVQAWARAAQTNPEARQQLVRATEREHGAATVAAALALLAGQKPAEAPADAVVAAAVLGRSIKEGPTRVRVAAIEGAPIEWPELLEAVATARADSDDEVAVAAAERLVGVAKERVKALLRLRDVAPAIGPAANRAAAALVRLHDHSVLAVLDRDARSASAVDRSKAAVAYTELGEFERALRLLADPDALVRSAAACALVLPAADEP